jgi:HPt (histidine-containing phosphotransfer) domain-containing protein
MVLDEYVADIKSYIHNIDAAVTHRQLNNIATYAHPLKSSSMALGFTGLGHIAKDMEITAKTHMANDNAFPDSLNEHTKNLDAAYIFVCKTIEDYKQV